jgi:hypothetical protein
MPAPLRTKSVSSKVTEEEYARLEQAAQERGISLSEWSREALLAALEIPPSPHKSETQIAVLAEVMLGEVLGLRTILINALREMARGEPVSDELMQQIIAHADAGKLAKAQARLDAATKSSGNGAIP